MSVRRVDFLDEEGVLACLTGDDTDLDDALLAMLYAEATRTDMEWEYENDSPTRIRSGSWRAELDVRRFRKVPCHCGNDHAWDLSDSWQPGNLIRGTFWGVLA